MKVTAGDESQMRDGGDTSGEKVVKVIEQAVSNEAPKLPAGI